MVKRIFLSFLLLPFSIFAIKVDCFLKKGNEIFRYSYNNGSKFLEKWSTSVNFPAFENFKVKKFGDKLFVTWKISDPSVDKFLVIGDNGYFRILKDTKLVLNSLSLLKNLEIYPLTKSGKPSLPARVELDG